ncbi:UDP-N-acetylmuramate dehydrogenase [Bifidobacterium sp. ESL0763]|uniref:UDP-N-acetylmuramate dehydrogenase n=1 Tax=Bifidobacterium sp. ESL0763 TaxID=2983227 RepID=UPI0023F7C647|nr:UDP-N-acetylmuramate dehydrogenase [Bifidobacterium sp. ESL0763]MDF7663424.1 UDP-N-acetylmuramate dehydrogenase [Bifidobacterium sp. ESL0763]
MNASGPGQEAAPTLAQLTTIGVGGPVARFVEPESEADFIDAVHAADRAGMPLLVIGGGSNLLAGDAAFDGVVVRDRRRGIEVLPAAETQSGQHADAGEGLVTVRADAGVNWDDFVAFCVSSGFMGVEGLSGVPGTVGASVVQNIGAYGQEVATSVVSVRVLDRASGEVDRLGRDDMRFGYRSSLLKSSMYAAPAKPADSYFPTPRYVVLSVTFALRRGTRDEVAFGQLAKALGVRVGERMPIGEIRRAVLEVRAGKGMLEDPGRYATPWMRGCKDKGNVPIEGMDEVNAPGNATGNASGDTASSDTAGPAMAGAPDFDRHSCGSFFMNPILASDVAQALPEDAPRFDATQPNGQPGVKTSAAWLIDHAGFHKGFKVRPDAHAGLSSRHTLALTNRGGATAADIAELARTIQDGVERAYGIRLVPEPVVVGMDLR